MKKLGLALILVVLAVSACDNKLPPTKAPGAEQRLPVPNKAPMPAILSRTWSLLASEIIPVQ